MCQVACWLLHLQCSALLPWVPRSLPPRCHSRSWLLAATWPNLNHLESEPTGGRSRSGSSSTSQRQQDPENDTTDCPSVRPPGPIGWAHISQAPNTPCQGFIKLTLLSRQPETAQVGKVRRQRVKSAQAWGHAADHGQGRARNTACPPSPNQSSVSILPGRSPGVKSEAAGKDVPSRTTKDASACLHTPPPGERGSVLPGVHCAGIPGLSRWDVACCSLGKDPRQHPAHP